MPLFTSGSSQWRRFAMIFIGVMFGCGLAIWLFIVIIDPWNILPASPPFNRIPISTNARYSMPALAMSDRFDSAMIGTSTSRLLRPQFMNGPFGARFVNLSMNTASPWEQEKIFSLFLRHHPQPKVVTFDIDFTWCFQDINGPNRPFPYWMYEGSLWKGYLHMADLYALQEASNQFLWLIGLKKQRYGSDGYTTLLPVDYAYNPKVVNKVFREWWPTDSSPPNGRSLDQPALRRLVFMLKMLPTNTLKIVWIPPFSAEFFGKEGGWTNMKWQACKADITKIIQDYPNAIAIDFAQPSPITSQRSNFWDPIHYRNFIADKVMIGLIEASLHHQPLLQNQSRILGFGSNKKHAH